MAACSRVIPLIPRNILFGNPDRDGLRLSPDGKMLSYLAPVDGKLSVWIKAIGQADDRMVAHDPVRPIPMARWQGDGKHILYLQDAGGNENYHLFQVDLLGNPPLDLTPGTNVRAHLVATEFHSPDDALLAMNKRLPSLMDVYRVHFPTGTLTLVTETPGDVLVWMADHRLQVRAAIAQCPHGGYAIRVRDAESSEWAVLEELAFEDGLPRLTGFSADNQSLYAVTAKDANTNRLVRYDLRDGSCAVLFEHPNHDVDKVYFDPATNDIAAVAVLADRLEWTALSERLQGALASFAALGVGELTSITSSSDGETLLLQSQSDTSPDDFYLYRLGEVTPSLLFHGRPALRDYTLAPVQPVTFPARDGLQLHGYLTLPVGAEPKALPAVLYVHGGPWYRDRWGFDPIVQWLANRGYAVLQVNFRGSTGYGKAFLNAGNREWAGAMRTDLLDARAWAVANGYADPLRFAIFGASYGGYAVLTALAWTPAMFRCGVDIVGPSDLTTFMASIPAYWEPMRKMFTERVGEEEDFLRSHSPLYRVAAIEAPLLIAQGANDPRVKRQESEQMVQALRARGTEVEYLLYENEGHGLAHQENLQHFVSAAEVFLARHLGADWRSTESGDDASNLQSEQ